MLLGGYVLERLVGKKKSKHLEQIMELADYFRANPELDDISRGATVLPHEPGIYGWYFNSIPPKVPHGDCARVNGWALLYIGIAAKDIRERILNEHFHGNAYGSTLRLSLGCLLSIQLQQPGRSGKRLTFGDAGESRLSEWMSEHARVAWVSDKKLFTHKKVLECFERRLVEERYSLPLNIEHNKKHPFCAELRKIRKDCRRRAFRL
ncbi:MAG: GIY-YIG nuclease family protein [Planctomycetota bacterium]